MWNPGVRQWVRLPPIAIEGADDWAILNQKNFWTAVHPGVGDVKTDRDIAVEDAAQEINEALLTARKKYRLTTLEYLSILFESLGQTTKFALRDEREGQKPKPSRLDDTEILGCGCTVMRGWRCPVHDGP